MHVLKVEVDASIKSTLSLMMFALRTVALKDQAKDFVMTCSEIQYMHAALHTLLSLS